MFRAPGRRYLFAARISARAALIASCTSSIRAWTSAVRTRSAGTGGSTRTVRRLPQFKHHGEDLHARLTGQGEGSGLEAVDLAVLRARALGEDRHRGAAGDPLPALAQKLFERFGGASAVDADVAVQHEELSEERHAEDLALGDPAEIERHVVERRNVDHRIVVEHDDVALAPVDVFEALDAAAPAQGDEEEDPHQDAREFVHDAPPLVERHAEHQGHGRQDHEQGAQQHQKEVIDRTQHRLRGIGRYRFILQN